MKMFISIFGILGAIISFVFIMYIGITITPWGLLLLIPMGNSILLADFSDKMKKIQTYGDINRSLYLIEELQKRMTNEYKDIVHKSALDLLDKIKKEDNEQAK